MTASYAPGTLFGEVAVFPLPQVVLFPGALMPLHIFEPRYRTMTRDVMASTRRICIAQIPEDHDLNERGQPDITNVAGLGEIVQCDPLPDGRFNILVQGLARVKVEELPFKKPYRRAKLTVLETSPGVVDGTLPRALWATATQLAGSVRTCHPGFKFPCPEATEPGKLADACAHYLVLCGTERQKLLETLDDAERVRRCLETLLMQKTLLGGGADTVH